MTVAPDTTAPAGIRDGTGKIARDQRLRHQRRGHRQRRMTRAANRPVIHLFLHFHDASSYVICVCMACLRERVGTYYKPGTRRESPPLKDWLCARNSERDGCRRRVATAIANCEAGRAYRELAANTALETNRVAGTGNLLFRFSHFSFGLIRFSEERMKLVAEYCNYATFRARRGRRGEVLRLVTLFRHFETRRLENKRTRTWEEAHGGDERVF